MKRNLTAESSSSSHSGKALPGSYMHPVFTLVCFSKRIKTLLALKKKFLNGYVCTFLGRLQKKTHLAGCFLGRPFSWQTVFLAGMFTVSRSAAETSPPPPSPYHAALFLCSKPLPTAAPKPPVDLHSSISSLRLSAGAAYLPPATRRYSRKYRYIF